MREDRRLRILDQLLSDNPVGMPAKTLCQVATLVTGLSGAGVMLMNRDRPQGSLCASDPVSDRLEALQFDLGEGHGIDAHHQGGPVLAADLSRSSGNRWPAFAPAAVEAGARAVFAFPLRVGATRMGALDLHRDEPGDLSDDQHADALVLADIAARTLLLHQSDAPVGAALKLVVHQASGMVAAQLDVGVDEALARMRGHAFARGIDLDDVARAVVTRTLRFDSVDDGEGTWS